MQRMDASVAFCSIRTILMHSNHDRMDAMELRGVDLLLWAYMSDFVIALLCVCMLGIMNKAS